MKKLLTRTLSVSLSLLSLLIITILLLLFLSCPPQILEIIKEILIGIISAIILLLLIEWRNNVKDNEKYGFINGIYKKVFIAERNPGGLNCADLQDTFWQDKNKKKIDGSCYHELNQYKLSEKDYVSDLKYQSHGIYTGTVEYFADWEIKATVSVTLNLNLANKMTGTGSYKYAGKDDYGKYDFQVDEENTHRIIVYYKNTIPSGLAEGYEIWERI